MKVGFGDPASNDVIVRDVVLSLADLRAVGALVGGPLLKINGPASLPVAVVIAHAVCHIYGAVAVSHRPDLAVGDDIE